MPASSAAEHASEASVRTGRESGVGRGGGGGRKWCGIGRVVRSAETGPPDCDAKTKGECSKRQEEKTVISAAQSGKGGSRPNPPNLIESGLCSPII